MDDVQAPRVEGNLYRYRAQHDSFDLHIGADYRGLAGVLSDEPTVAKLNAPAMAFVTRDAAALGPLSQQQFQAIQSFALGGLGNAWGAGLYRWISADLQDFPIGLAELEPYFDLLTREIGISGADDDLTEFFGDAAGLQPPLELSYNARRVALAYRRRRNALRARRIYLGRPRAGVLSAPKDGRPACDYSNLEFWQPQPFIYTPAVTLRRLIAAGQIDYRPGLLVQRWQETADGVTVYARDIASGAAVEVDRSPPAAGRRRHQQRAHRPAERGRPRGPSAVAGKPRPADPRRPAGLAGPPAGYARLRIGAAQPGLGVGRLPDDPARQPVGADCAAARRVLRPLSAGRAGQPGAGASSAAGHADAAALFPRLGADAFAPLAAGGWPPAHPGPALPGRAGPAGAAAGQPAQPGAVDAPGADPAARHRPRHPLRRHAAHARRARAVPVPAQTAGCTASARVYVADSASFSNLSAKNMSLGMMANAMRIAAEAAA
ncbi:MAG: hypothetical protein V9H69_13360 [Anaerolineae bacterium]